MLRGGMEPVIRDLLGLHEVVHVLYSTHIYYIFQITACNFIASRFIRYEVRIRKKKSEASYLMQ